MNCFFPYFQLPGSSGNNQTTLENRRGNQPDVTLDDIVKDLVSFFNGFQCLHETKTKIEDTCDIKRGSGGRWSADDIKEAWKETKNLDIKSDIRQHRAHVIMLQVLKRCLYYGGFNRLEAQSDLKEVETSPKLSDEAEITPSETEHVPSEIPSSSETRNNTVSKATRNDDSNIITTIKELCVSNKENVKEQTMKENPPGREKNVMVQAHSEPSIQPPTKRSVNEISGSEDCDTFERNNEEKYPNKLRKEKLEKMDDGTWRRGVNKFNSQTVYIRIPLSVMSGNESTCRPKEITNVNPTYKLIDRVPNLTEIRKKKSYAMLYDNRTRNAAWVYEILNKSTLEKEKDFTRVYKVDDSIHPFFQTPIKEIQSDKNIKTNFSPKVHKGHLAAAANHQWCEKAFKDTNVFSNITMQDSNLNRNEWGTFENDLRDKIKNNAHIRNVHVYTGPLYVPNGTRVSYLMKHGKAVPTHYFKVVIEENIDDTVKLEGYVVPNQGITVNIQQYKQPINYIEQVSGLIFIESLYNEEGDSLQTVTWKGENQHGEPCEAKSNVRCSAVSSSISSGPVFIKPLRVTHKNTAKN